MGLKANDCRYGNYIIYGGSITQLNEKEMCHFFRFPESYKPIPLTEEWLLKFSFKQEENPFWFCNNVISISPSTGNYVLYGKSGREITRTGLKYVHQLQNLHFALTNEELEIKK